MHGNTNKESENSTEKSRKNPLGPACMSEINGIIAEARTREPFPIGSHEGDYFDRGYRGSAAQQDVLFART